MVRWLDKSGTGKLVSFTNANTFNPANLSVNTNSASSAFFSANLDIRKSTAAAKYLHMFFVYRWGGFGVNTDQTSWGGDAGGGWNRGQILSFPGFTDVAYALTYQGGGGPNAIFVSGLNTGSTVIYSAIYALNIASGTYVRLNGTLATSQVTEGAPSTQSPTTNTFFGTITGTNYIASCSFNEIIAYTSPTTALTTLQIQQVEGYLAWKWNLVASLPSTHPYKNSPP
jgi:hypothetical protein